MLSLISIFTRKMQLKGAARILWSVRSLLVKRSHIYPVCDGLHMRLDETQLYQWWYAVNYAGYELVKLSHRLLRPGDQVIDAGANIGYVTLNAARLVSPEGRVFAFEPCDHTYRRLCGNVALNNAANITCFQHAVSEQSGEATFIIATDDGLSRLDNSAGNTFGLVMADRVKVKVETLDDVWAKQLTSQKVKLLKLDIEGGEVFALRGGAHLLRSGCQYVISEINSPALRQNRVGLSDMMALMTECGFSAYWIESHTADWLRFTRMPSLREVTDGDIRNEKSGDILFVKNHASGEFQKNCGDLIRK